MSYPSVMTEDATLDAALAGRSLARFGDGELRLALERGGSASSQRAIPELAQELRDILASPGPALACIPRLDECPRADAWSAYANGKYVKMYRLPEYGSSFITRPDNMPNIDRPDYWAKVRRLWLGKDVILVVGDAKSLTPEFMSEAKSVIMVRGPRQHAYAEIDKIEAQIVRCSAAIGLHPISVFMCLGATATVLAARLARKGIHAVDLGHIGMFMRSKSRIAQVALAEVTAQGSA